MSARAPTPGQLGRCALAACAALLATGAAADKAASSATPAVRMTRSTPKLHAGLRLGFEAYRGGDLAAAEAQYGEALKAEPGNRHALHGAALVALRKGERDRAEEFYRRAVLADPRDAVAQSGLIALRGGGAAAAAEARLKSLIAEQPDEPSLQFAIGNVYAASGRWRDAQQAFFSAHSAAPDQPDYLFNLAVSLDHLNQRTLARRYYEKAVAAAAGNPAAFDPSQAALRLQELR